MAEIAYQNKDIISKALAENLENKSLNVYGLNLPKIVAALPTNLPVVEANELRIDNIFLFIQIDGGKTEFHRKTGGACQKSRKPINSDIFIVRATCIFGQNIR